MLGLPVDEAPVSGSWILGHLGHIAASAAALGAIEEALRRDGDASDREEGVADAHPGAERHWNPVVSLNPVVSGARLASVGFFPLPAVPTRVPLLVG